MCSILGFRLGFALKKFRLVYTICSVGFGLYVKLLTQIKETRRIFGNFIELKHEEVKFSKV